MSRRWTHSKEKTANKAVARTLFHAFRYLDRVHCDQAAFSILRPLLLPVTAKFRVAHKTRCKFCARIEMLRQAIITEEVERDMRYRGTL
jgi:hypothetical protein